MLRGGLAMSKILDKVSNSRVFFLETHDDNTVSLTEGCDLVFWCVLNKEDLKALSEELGEIADSMKTGGVSMAYYEGTIRQ
jgi:3-hydroxyisobutyrate dehydrogenase-like beta-hydroxyacid dehydrogenase